MLLCADEGEFVELFEVVPGTVDCEGIDVAGGPGAVSAEFHE